MGKLDDTIYQGVRKKKRAEKQPQKQVDKLAMLISKTFLFIDPEPEVALSSQTANEEPMVEVNILRPVCEKRSDRHVLRRLIAQRPFVVISEPDLEVLSVSPESLLMESSIPQHRSSMVHSTVRTE
ncbi:hypothetical protein CRM22_008210 [Opisthorchis felineus]|uniref:Uncharacterized protein n=1 Tax=Opisthorchis felineus TaxID=147828 RepID=A0A4V3SDK5_OPIFE|nr:hypothetical protein CRM22_008210 [Opisthorchis felineus]